MKKPEEELAGALGVVLAVALVLLIALPLGYLIKVQVRTGSPYLLVAILTFAATGVLAVITQVAVLAWLAALLGVASLVIARVEEVRACPPSDKTEFSPLPFEGYRW